MFSTDLFDNLMKRFSTKMVACSIAGIAVAGAGVSTALVRAEAPHPAAADTTARTAQVAAEPSATPSETGKPVDLPKRPAQKAAMLPSGVSTGTSFWDPSTASGKPMSYHTLASPYWPLGTKVKITIGGKSAVGVVEDFGPAEWAVAQHNPPAIVDLSEEMMQYLTGTRSNSVPIKFQVLEMGHGPVYRHGGTGYDMATGISEK
jgi:hypothetical protein